MKVIVVLAALVAVASAGAIDAETYVVKEQPHNNIGIGDYQFSVEQSDGQARSEVATAAVVRNPETNEDHTILRVQGQYSYVDQKTGKSFVVYYTADENGYHPQGDHLPK
ncbi:larval cuticle protein 5-like [Copidosoma floridanum]|uniref:larval cuticle protein 5-like n=1 Tax=Copidosoma floridanum TaxID=29053 RepID=UPI0006C9CBF5|nr:larval cuticle protein 5-like [Copidosoma floridanum]